MYILLLQSLIGFCQLPKGNSSISVADFESIESINHLSFSVDSVLNNDSLQVFLASHNDSCTITLDSTDTIQCHLSEIGSLIKSKLNMLNNEGYALARMNIVKSSSQNHVQVNTTKGDLYTLDSITLRENIISSGFLEQVLNLKIGQKYELDKIKRIESQLNTIPFLTLKSPPLLYFYDGKYKLLLDLQKVGTNQFNGIVGLVPDNSNPNITTYRLNGNLNLSLNNTFKLGESFNFKWNRASENIQMLNTDVRLPFVFNSPYSIEGALDFLQKDSSFLNVDYTVSAAYQNGFNQSISAFYNQKISTTLNQESNSNSSHSNFYGISLNSQNLNHFIIPTRGCRVLFKASVGERQLNSSLENDSILINVSEDSNSQVNLSVPVRSTITQIEFNLEKYWQLKQRLILFQEIKSKAILNPYLLNNEMMFIGGINTVRGFDNSSLSGSQYYISRNEIRFHLERFSFVSAFFDYTELISNQIVNYNRQSLISLGVGGQISSKAGVFSLYYALSKQGNQAIFFRDAKIHIGFKNNF